MKLSDGSLFVFGGRESPLKPCLDYGIFRVNEMYGEHSNEDDFSETHLSKGASFIWRGKLSPHSSNEQERTEPYPRWRHSATTVSINGIVNSVVYCLRKEHLGVLS